jgi:protein-S-isoprenylcysteine O-methyltransferase Ste14
MHSVLIDTSVPGFIKKHAPGLTRYYRILYNAFSLITLIPLVIATGLAEGRVIINWEGYAVPVRILLLAAAFMLFMGGAKKYDLSYFFGLKQLKTGEEHLLLTDTEEFSETGVFGITRHPWYFGSLLFLWSILPAYPLPVFLAVCILSIYLVLGAMLEERKIIAQYDDSGDNYRRYRQRVSMLFPWKWLMQLFRK